MSDGERRRSLVHGNWEQWNATLRQLFHCFLLSLFLFLFTIFSQTFSSFSYQFRRHVNSPFPTKSLPNFIFNCFFSFLIFSRFCFILNLWFLGSLFRHFLLMEIRADAETSSLSRFSTCFSFSSSFSSISFSITVSHTASITTSLTFHRWILLLRILDIQGSRIAAMTEILFSRSLLAAVAYGFASMLMVFINKAVLMQYAYSMTLLTFQVLLLPLLIK